MIPKIIWQTYKNKNIPYESIECIKSWINLNPEYEWIFFDDETCERFIVDHFSSDFVSMYQSLPYGVMKADTWRIAVVYVYGGIYSDIDTNCIQPINFWAKDYELIVSSEPPTNTIANFCFAATPKHPALYSALENLLKNYKNPNFMDKIEKTGTPVQNYGQHAFHEALKNYFDNNNNSKEKLFKMEENAFTPFCNEKTLVWHRAGSITWSNEYDSWRKHQFNHFGY